MNSERTLQRIELLVITNGSCVVNAPLSRSKYVPNELKIPSR